MIKEKEGREGGGEIKKQSLRRKEVRREKLKQMKCDEGRMKDVERKQLKA